MKTVIKINLRRYVSSAGSFEVYFAISVIEKLVLDKSLSFTPVTFFEMVYD